VTAQAFPEWGWVLDIIGALLLYFFGLPEAVLVERYNWVEERYPMIARWCGRFGLPLVILGFIFQLIGAHLSG
jgi:hypothetical protein